jgi:hypothetical protein
MLFSDARNGPGQCHRWRLARTPHRSKAPPWQRAERDSQSSWRNPECPLHALQHTDLGRNAEIWPQPRRPGAMEHPFVGSHAHAAGLRGTFHLSGAPLPAESAIRGPTNSGRAWARSRATATQHICRHPRASAASRARAALSMTPALYPEITPSRTLFIPWRRSRRGSDRDICNFNLVS